MASSVLPDFPDRATLETPAIFRELVDAHRYLAELKGVARTIPNERLLISTLALQEAQSSSEVENIITTQDALYRERLQPEQADPASKEVAGYARALDVGFRAVRENGLLTLNTIQAIQQELVGNDAGFRRTPGTVLRNRSTGRVVFEPPSSEHVPALMARFEEALHDEDSPIDPLVRMTVLHHRFETIHPFYDGNGRTGRIINVLFLVKEGLLDTPVLYLSRYVSQTKASYYQELQRVRDEAVWESWVCYLLRGVAVTARHTTRLVSDIGRLLQNHKHRIRADYRFYSQDLINNIFRHPYTKVAFLEEELRVSRATAARYLDQLTEGGILTKHRMGRENYYVNTELVKLLFELPPLES